MVVKHFVYYLKIAAKWIGWIRYIHIYIGGDESSHYHGERDLIEKYIKINGSMRKSFNKFTNLWNDDEQYMKKIWSSRFFFTSECCELIILYSQTMTFFHENC